MRGQQFDDLRTFEVQRDSFLRFSFPRILRYENRSSWHHLSTGARKWYISVTRMHTSKLTARSSRDSNRDLVWVLGVAALILHSLPINLIFQYLHFRDLVLHDLIGCVRRRLSRDGPCPPSAWTQESRRFFASFGSLCVVINV